MTDEKEVARSRMSVSGRIESSLRKRQQPVKEFAAGITSSMRRMSAQTVWNPKIFGEFVNFSDVRT